MREIFDTVGGVDSGASNGIGVKPAASSTEYIQWRVDFASDAGCTGLQLAPFVEGKFRRVSGISQNSALEAWNQEKMPVTVFLKPSDRETVLSNIVVKPGDELLAIDGEPIGPLLEEADRIAECMEQCTTLTFRRNVQRRGETNA